MSEPNSFITALNVRPMKSALSVVSEAYRQLALNLGAIVKIVLPVVIPFEILANLVVTTLKFDVVQDWRVALIDTVLYILIDSFLIGAVVHVATCRMRGLPLPSLSESYKTAASFYGRVLFTNLRYTVWVIVGLALLIVPGLYVMVRIGIAPIAAILEPDQKDPIRRSAELTKGRFWFVAPAMGAVVLTLQVISLLAQLVLHNVFYFVGEAVMDVLVDSTYALFAQVLPLTLFLLYVSLVRERKNQSFVAEKTRESDQNPSEF